jgi:hypothetical protein
MKRTPFEVNPTRPGHCQLHTRDGYNGFESIVDLNPAQIDELIQRLTTVCRATSKGEN